MANTKIIYIENAGIKLGILVEIGGTIAFLSKDGSENILECDNSLWDNSKKPEVNAEADFMPYNGHTIWVGPQSEWWTQQTINKARKDDKAVWPPDPYISYGTYKVINETASSIKIQSPESPVSRIQIEKEIAINPDGSIFQQVRFVNYSQEAVNWDIWFNTRVNGWNKAYVFATKDNVRIEDVPFDGFTKMEYQIEDGIFNFTPDLPPKDMANRGSKAYIYPEKSSIFSFSKDFMLRIDFEKHKKAEIHPEQAHIEIYNNTEHNKDNSLLELEYHAPYNTILPGEYTEAWQVWEILEYKGENNSNAHISYLKSL